MGLARHRGLLLAVLVVAACIAWQHRRFDDPHIVYTRWSLPAFDTYVYMAMADGPVFFTVAPWGYRILHPWLAQALPGRDVLQGFEALTLGTLVAAGALLFLFLRRLGHGEWPSLLAVAAFGASGPAGWSVRYPFLAEPLCVALEAAFLLALESGASAAVLALLLATGALSKEMFVLFVPGVYLALRERVGDRRALATAALAGLPAALVTLLLRLSWGPHGGAGADLPGPGAVLSGALRILEAFPDWWEPVLLAGLTPVGLLGALRPGSRPYLRRYGYFIVLTLALPLAAAVYTGEDRPGQFFSLDVPRLILYAVPLVLPLALLALDRMLPQVSPAPSPGRTPGVASAAAALGAAMVVALPVVLVDRYRRTDLSDERDGPYVLSFCRESLRTANRLDRGLAVTWDPDSRRFISGVNHPSEMGRMRWFLLEGWGEKAYYGTRDIGMRETRASVVVPCLRPRDLDVFIVADAPREDRVEVQVNGTRVGELGVGTEPRETAFRIPAALLFRGDNRLSFVAARFERPWVLRVHELTLRPAP